MVIDLRQGFGDFPEYKLFKFPDGSIKFELKKKMIEGNSIIIKATLRNSDDILALAMIKDVADRQECYCVLDIDYMMYQQDDRRFSEFESFGLKVIANFINSLNFKVVRIFHPHSDKVEMINTCKIIDNGKFLRWTLRDDKFKEALWIIPDAGAFKTQYKQASEFEFGTVTCGKVRDHKTGELTTRVHMEDFQGKDCFIVDDICLGGATFINIAKELKVKNCGRLYLIISHGVFNKGIDHLLEYFDTIYTTDSICTLPESDKLKIYKL